MFKKAYIVDTNVILQDTEILKRLSANNSNILVIPETVLLEVEYKKKGFSDISYQAREFVRILQKLKTKETDSTEDITIVKKYNDYMNVHIVARKHYNDIFIDPNNIAESNDKKIIEVSKDIKKYYKDLDVIFLSLDAYARTFAQMAGLDTQTLQDDKDEKPELNFIKEFPLESAYFNTLINQPIMEIDDQYKPENFSYKFISSDGNNAYAIIQNERILLIDDDDFKKMKVRPVNLQQKMLAKSILTDIADIIVVDAKAGSGKTLIALVAAMRLIDEGKYDGIVYVRNSIESIDKGADIGYLPGHDEKFRIYNMALEDTISFIAKNSMKKSENRKSLEAIDAKCVEIQQKYNIQTLWPGEARGRTLSNMIVILDEWQNSSNKTTQLILSRLDNNCKSIVIGSNRQIDNTYLNKFNNGLTYLLSQTTQKHDEINMFAIELQKAVRGRFAEFAECIYEHGDK
jgi:PhoH-like ATPase